MQKGSRTGGEEGTEESLLASFGALPIKEQDNMLQRLQRLTTTLHDIKTQANHKSDEQSCLVEMPSNRLLWDERLSLQLSPFGHRFFDNIGGDPTFKGKMTENIILENDWVGCQNEVK